MKDDTLKIVDFYFTNSLDELNSVKTILETNNIPHEIIQNNNNHPYFGINTALGIEKNLYDYVIRIPENFIEHVEYILSEEFSNEESMNKTEEETPVEIENTEIKKSDSIKNGYFVLLLFFTHYSRYFYSLKKINQNKKKQIILTIVGIIHLILSYSLLFINDCSLIGNFEYGLYRTLLIIGSVQTVINLIDFIIERQRLQKYLFIIFGLITLLVFFTPLLYFKYGIF